MVGEFSFFSGKKRSTNIRVKTTGILHQIDFETFCKCTLASRMKQVPLLNFLTINQVESLVKVTEQKFFNSRDIIVEYGSEATHFCIVNCGTVSVDSTYHLAALEERKEEALESPVRRPSRKKGTSIKTEEDLKLDSKEELAPNDHFGSIEIIGETMYKATIIATSEVALITIPKRYFFQYLGRVRRVIRSVVASRNKKMKEKFPRAKLIHALETNELFVKKKLAQSGIEKIVDNMIPVELNRGDVLCCQGERSDEIFMLHEGEIMSVSIPVTTKEDARIALSDTRNISQTDLP